MTDGWPPFAAAALGAFHGLNPGMGWLFAVALGLHRQSRAVLLISLLPIAAGHTCSIVAVAGLLAASGYLVPQNFLRMGPRVLLLGWAAYHWRFGHRHRVRFGLQTGLCGLAIWSFLMATAHGAGVMLWPALMPLCFAEFASGLGGPTAEALIGVGIHALAMLTTTVIVAGLIYEWVGLSLLPRVWINIDLVWT